MEHGSYTKIELGQILQLGQMLHPVVSDRALAEIELGQILQLGQMLHPVVNDFFDFVVVTKIKQGQVLQLGQMLHPDVSGGALTEV